MRTLSNASSLWDLSTMAGGSTECSWTCVKPRKLLCFLMVLSWVLVYTEEYLAEVTQGFPHRSAELLLCADPSSQMPCLSSRLLGLQNTSFCLPDTGHWAPCLCSLCCSLESVMGVDIGSVIELTSVFLSLGDCFPAMFSYLLAVFIILSGENFL